MSNRDFIISDSGNNDPDVESHIYCRYPLDECGDCVHNGEAMTIQVDASDPDGDSIFYDWHAWMGTFAENGQHSITTAENYVTYVAPTMAETVEKVPTHDYVSIAVTDVRGGQAYADARPELYDQAYSCMCGDATGNSVVDLGDAVRILNYLFKGMEPPPEPILRADANNTCEIDMGDAVRILNYLFSEGEDPECCWFPPTGRLLVRESP